MVFPDSMLLQVCTVKLLLHAKSRRISNPKCFYTLDLTPLFNWNTKQLFVYVQAEYTSADGTENEVVIWDRIIRRKEDAVIKVANGRPKYPLRDMARTFKYVPFNAVY